MSLAAGSRLGPYEIVAPLGAGGMGEVWRARDARLGRDVAVKVLPEHLSAQPEVRARFEREARAISSLSHPNICALYDIGREGDVDYLVMELVEGETLAARLERGALSAPDVVRIGAQVAEALDRAHRAGVVHRDLKPGNVMLTKRGAKLMDFGLARTTGLAGPAGSGASVGALTQSPTVARALTAEGTIVGTFQYMAPEQLEGGEADARSDLWAMGCVLYEMATGRRAFEGRSQASLISAIMREQPAPPSQLVPASPPALDRLVARCLAKDPDDRWQTARDLMHELRALEGAGAPSSVTSAVSASPRVPPRRAALLPWAVASLGLVAAAVLGALVLRGRTPRPPVVLSLIPAPGTTLTPRTSKVQVSPDGRSIAYVARDSAGVPSVYVRALGGTADVRVLVRPGGANFAWSPDSRSLAIGSDGSRGIAIVPATGGSPTLLPDLRATRGIAFNRGGTLVFAPSPSGPLFQASVSNGLPAQATWLDSTRHETGHRFPCFLPDGRHFLFAALPRGPEGFPIFLGELGSRKVRELMRAGSAPTWVEPGWLFFRRGSKLMAQRFDPRALALRGEPVALTDAPAESDYDADPVASVSNDGTLVMLDARPPLRQLEWHELGTARSAALALPPGHWAYPFIAPDDRTAVAVDDGDLYRIDLERAVATRLTASGQVVPECAWSPDGRRIAFTERRGREEIVVMASDGSGTTRQLQTTDDNFKNPESWSRQGLVFQVLAAQTGQDLFITDVDGAFPARPLVRGAFLEHYGRVSPDGRWLAYLSSETGSDDIYVQAFPGLGHKVRVTSDGASALWWLSGSDAILFTSASSSALQRVSLVHRGEELEPGAPQPVLTGMHDMQGGDLSHDGRRMLVSLPRRGGTPPSVRVILNWTSMVPK